MCINPGQTAPADVRQKTWTFSKVITSYLRCFMGFSEPGEILIRDSLYQRM